MYDRMASYYKWNDARNRRMVLPRPRDLFFLGEQVAMSGEKLHNQSIQSEGYNLSMFNYIQEVCTLWESFSGHGKSMCFPFLHGVLLPGWTTGHNKVEVIRLGKVDLLSHQWMRNWATWKHKPHKNRNYLHDERILGTWIGTGGRALTLRIRSGDVGEHLKSRMSINITIYYIRIWEYIR
jgi:hypothetical protein